MRPLYVLSDLHLAPADRLNNFHAGKALCKFLEHLPRGSGLVLNGDTFDLLQLSNHPGVLDWVGAASLLREMLSELARTSGGNELLGALAAHVKSGGECVVIPGNHDPELFHPDCEQVLRRALGLGDGAALGIHRSAEPWRCEAGALDVVIGHGHRSDTWNDIDPRVVHEHLRAGAQKQALPPGSALVVNTLNAFKRALDPETGEARFPFIDRLKPELPGVALLLLYLDPRLACAHLPGVAHQGWRGLLRSLNRLFSQTPALAASSVSAPSGDAGERAAEDIAAAIFAEIDVNARSAPEATLENLRLGLMGKDEVSAPGSLSAHSGRLRSVLRAAVRRLSYDQSFFDRRARSDIDAAIINEWLGPEARDRVVIAGHTHAAREIALAAGCSYLNTGTWTDLLPLPTGLSDSDLQQWTDDLEAGRLESLRFCTYAVIDEQGARLEEWPHDAP